MNSLIKITLDAGTLLSCWLLPYLLQSEGQGSRVSGKKCKPTKLCKMSESKYSGLLCYENCVSLHAHWLLNGTSNVWYESNFFQDSLEELKLVVRGSLIQVASLQDCFLQQSEPLATTNTGVYSQAVCSLPSINPQGRDGLGPIPEGWAVSRALL